MKRFQRPNILYSSRRLQINFDCVFVIFVFFFFQHKIRLRSARMRYDDDDDEFVLRAEYVIKCDYFEWNGTK